MSQKSIIMIAATAGSLLGSYIPTLFGAGLLSYSSIIGSGIGGILGIYLGYKLGNS